MSVNHKPMGLKRLYGLFLLLLIGATTELTYVPTYVLGVENKLKAGIVTFPGNFSNKYSL